MRNARISTMLSEFNRVEPSNINDRLFLRKDGPFLGFTWEVNGPIISLEYDSHTFPYPPGELTATLGISEYLI